MVGEELSTYHYNVQRVLTATFKECTKHNDNMGEEMNFFWGRVGRVLYM